MHLNISNKPPGHWACGLPMHNIVRFFVLPNYGKCGVAQVIVTLVF
jgi:hypothetical protein